MSYLTLDADRLVREAVDTYLDDRMRPDSGGDCVYATRNSQYRVVEGNVHEASDPSLVGAELVGWLLEELGQPEIEPRWRAHARAVFVERKSRHVVVTSRTLTRTAIGGDVPPPGKGRRRTPSVIPPSPPIPVLKQTGGLAEGSPTPFRVPEGIRESARAMSAHERPTSRPPPRDEMTIAADRGSYENLVEQSRTPTWGNAMPPAGSPAQPAFAPDALAPHAPPADEDEPKSVRLPPVNPPPRRTPVSQPLPPPPAAGSPARSTLDETTEETELGEDDLEDDLG